MLCVIARVLALLLWANWIREDLTSRPYKWLRPEFVPLAPYLVL